MKLAIRVLGLSIVIAGAAAASVSSSTPQVFKSHASAVSAVPNPWCGPHMPGCVVAGGGTGTLR